VTARGLLLVLPLAGCVFVGKPPAAPVVATPAPVAVHVDGLYGGRSAGSEWNRGAARARLAARIVFEAAALQPHAPGSATEPWTLSLLLGRLGQGGAEVLVEPLPPHPAPTTVVDAEGVAQVVEAPRPSAAVRGLQFAAGSDEFAATVSRQPDGSLRVAARHLPQEESECGADWSVPVGFVALRGTLQAWPLGEVAAIWDEVSVVPAPTPTVALALPPVGDSGFCAALRSALVGAPELEPGDQAFIEAANAALDAALGPLLPVPK